MQTKTMEGLIGAGMNMKMADVPMRVYKEARRKDDYAAMERAMGYVGDFAKKADTYQELADEGMKEDAKEMREREAEKLEEAAKKRREEYEKAQEKLKEKLDDKSVDKAKDKKEDGGAASQKSDIRANSLVRIDTVEVSEAGRRLLQESQQAETPRTSEATAGESGS
ncbi:MAG: hypothetical protein NC231_14975 [Bacillus sp. (in: Bacteria)]|nr:hypothetical protein [Bacillus sp. (in: firmicutes)]MCM1426080.1 hypothetical protein [Eubacterium sp.]